jgi:LytS/YehU family sensor histidine kinase
MHNNFQVNNFSNQYLQVLHDNMSQHFIFNTLNSINSFIVDNNAVLATDYIAKFGKLMRLMMENNNLQKVALAKELEALNLYVYLEQMRYNSAFKLQINIAENIDVQHIIVPALLLQPYIEKAIWQYLALDNSATKNIILDINLHKKDFLQYSITETKTIGKPKLLQAPLPHEVQAQYAKANEWAKENDTRFETETINLYNNEMNTVAIKTVITIPLTT